MYLSIIYGLPRNYEGKALYSIIARDVKSIPPKERYCMRGDRKGEVLDKVAMYVASRNLGHNRIDVIARNYLY